MLDLTFEMELVLLFLEVDLSPHLGCFFFELMSEMPPTFADFCLLEFLRDDLPSSFIGCKSDWWYLLVPPLNTFLSMDWANRGWLLMWEGENGFCY